MQCDILAATHGDESHFRTLIPRGPLSVCDGVRDRKNSSGFFADESLYFTQKFRFSTSVHVGVSVLQN